MILAIGATGLITVLPNTPSFALDINCSNVVSCYGTPQNDVMKGGMGNNQMHGFGGNDQMTGGPSNDYMVGYDGDDNIYSKEGDDKILGEQGNDGLWGDIGNDVIEGSSGNDRIGGAGGADQLSGGFGADYIWGEAGNDIIWHSNFASNSVMADVASDRSKDTLYCGDGYDRVYYNSGEGDVVSTDCEVKIDLKSSQPPRPPGNENCDRPGMPGCP